MSRSPFCAVDLRITAISCQVVLSQRPSPILDNEGNTIILGKDRVSWEELFAEANRQKPARYKEMAAKIHDAGCDARWHRLNLDAEVCCTVDEFVSGADESGENYDGCRGEDRWRSAWILRATNLAECSPGLPGEHS